MTSENRRIILCSLSAGLLAWALFLVFQTRGIYTGDSGDLVTAAVMFGVPHPPGYPLYTLVGWMFSLIPVATPAWRVTLASSFPHAVVIGLLFYLTHRITRRLVASLFVSVTAAGNYLFFLYSVTPEVFALFDLFIVALTTLVYEWMRTKQPTLLLAIVYVFSLSLAHHHVILFLVPALALVAWSLRKTIQSEATSLHSLFRFFGMVAFGLVPYLYIPIAAHGGSIINWDRAVDVPSFVRLVARADYGSFVSAGFFGSLPSQRILQVKAYGQFLLTDFRLIGLIMSIFGAVYLYRRNAQLLWFILLAILFVGPGFFFYASFPLMNKFTLATYERFLLPSYIFFFLLIGSGLAWLLDMAVRLKRLVSFPVSSTMVAAGVSVVMFLYPGAQAFMTLWRMKGMAQDQTANNLASDVLSSVPAGSIVLLGRDTVLFTTQYLRYAEGIRRDVIVLHASRMDSLDYRFVIQKNFPHVTVPTASSDRFTRSFIEANRDRFPIFSNTMVDVGDSWFWVPHGLLFRLVHADNLPGVDAMLETNRKMWESFHNPNAGILGRYSHLMLADVRDVYAGARLALAKVLLRAGKYAEAKQELSAGLTYGGETEAPDLYTYAGISDLLMGACNEALDAFQKAREASIVPSAMLTRYEAEVYRDCVGDQRRARELFDAYEQAVTREETPLE